MRFWCARVRRVRWEVGGEGERRWMSQLPRDMGLVRVRIVGMKELVKLSSLESVTHMSCDFCLKTSSKVRVLVKCRM